MKVFVLVNTLQSVSSFVYANHVEFFTYTKKERPDIEFQFFTPHRMSIDMARNMAADLAMKYKCDYLMFIDDDVLIPKDTLLRLLEADKDIVAGLVIIRGVPFNVMGFRWQELKEQHAERAKVHERRSLTFYNDLPLVHPCKEGHERFQLKCEHCLHSPLQTLVQMDAIGFSCCLIKTDVLNLLTPPYFVTGSHHTEDVYFCIKAQEELIPPPTIFMHTGVQCGHLLNPEPIEWRTRKRFLDFFTPEIEMEKQKKEESPRGMSYIERCLAKIDEVKEQV